MTRSLARPGRASLRPAPSLRAAGDLDAELAHELHVVLDDDHGVVLGDLLQQLGGLLRLGVGHAGDRLVDEQQLRVLREQHADLEPLLLAVADRLPARRLRGVGRGGSSPESRRCAPTSPLLPRQNSVPATLRSAFSASWRLSSHGVALEHGRLLELAADAELGDARPRRAGSGRCCRRTAPSPSSGLVLPVMMSIIVVLPAPFGPMMARISPGASVSDRLLRAWKPSKRDADAVEIEQVCVRSRGCP